MSNKKLSKLMKDFAISSLACAMVLAPIMVSQNIKIVNADTISNNLSNSKYSNLDYDVGQGIEWPQHTNVPFVDMVAWVTKSGYTNNGAMNLQKIYEDTGVKFFNLGFIQSTGGISNGKLNWGWGGYSVLNEDNPNNSQYNGIKNSIKSIRKVGGDITISLGGASGIPFWEATQDVNVLYNTYLDIVDGYNLTRLDLDIEGYAQNNQHNKVNAKAIKKLQEKTGVDIILTLPVLPSGLTSEGLGVLEAYLSEGVNIKIVNIMTMCYGNATLNPGENYGTGSIRAIDSTKDQIKQTYKKLLNTNLTDSEAYLKIGATPSVGFEGQAHPIYTTEWTKLLVDHAIEKQIGMTSMWSMNRDSMVVSNKGVSSQYQFTNIFKLFGSDNINHDDDKDTTNNNQNDSDKDNNSSDKKDNHDEDHHHDHDHNDDEDENKEPDDDSKTVEDPHTNPEDKNDNIEEHDEPPENLTYDSNKIYLEGDTCIYSGNKYTARWWTKGEKPGDAQVWQKELIINSDGSFDYYNGLICTGGEVVLYKGHLYKAKWWTNSKPGSDQTWLLIK